MPPLMASEETRGPARGLAAAGGPDDASVHGQVREFYADDAVIGLQAAAVASEGRLLEQRNQDPGIGAVSGAAVAVATR